MDFRKVTPDTINYIMHYLYQNVECVIPTEASSIFDHIAINIR
jgi:hypothetical protein